MSHSNIIKTAPLDSHCSSDDEPDSHASRRSSDQPLNHGYRDASFQPVDLTGILEDDGIELKNIDCTKSIPMLEEKTEIKSRPLTEIGKSVNRLFQLCPSFQETKDIGSFDFRPHTSIFFMDLIMSLFLLRTMGIIQSTMISPGITIMCFLGIFVPVHLSILKVFHEHDFLFGYDNIFHFFYTGVRLAFFFGVAFTSLSVYNSSRGSFFPFFLFLVILRLIFVSFQLIMGLYHQTLYKEHALPILIEVLPTALYTSCLILQSQLPYRADILYAIWATGTIVDVLGFVFVQISRSWRDPVQPAKCSSKEVSAVFDSLGNEQVFMHPFLRIQTITVAILALGITQFFPARRGVGTPDVSAAVVYDMYDFLTGLLGVLVLFFLVRLYASTMNRYPLSIWKSQSPRKMRIIGSLIYLIHLPLQASLLLVIGSLQMCISLIWDSFDGLSTVNTFYQFANDLDPYAVYIWSSLPVVTDKSHSNYLQSWVANQSSGNSTLPPGVLQFTGTTTGTSRLSWARSSPDVIFCVALGATLLFYTLMRMMPVTISADNESGQSRLRKLMGFFVRIAVIIIILGLAAVGPESLSMLTKLIILASILLIQTLLDDASRMLS